MGNPSTIGQERPNKALFGGGGDLGMGSMEFPMEEFIDDKY